MIGDVLWQTAAQLKTALEVTPPPTHTPPILYLELHPSKVPFNWFNAEGTAERKTSRSRKARAHRNGDEFVVVRGAPQDKGHE